MNTFLIYIAGYLISYAILRKVLRSFDKDKYTWSDVIFIAFLSLLSWLSVIAAIICYPYNLNSKPPRFL